ncbi:MAG: phosphatase PAP2 family protein [Rhodospirillaceae bacterium]|nr:phosphatase PAP2 family protein [Rhodospirillaceae bacterium]
MHTTTVLVALSAMITPLWAQEGAIVSAQPSAANYDLATNVILQTYWQRVNEQKPYHSAYTSPYAAQAYGYPQAAYPQAGYQAAYPAYTSPALPSGYVPPGAYVPYPVQPQPYAANTVPQRVSQGVSQRVSLPAQKPPVRQAAAAPPKDRRILTNMDYWKNYYRAPIDFVTAPLSWDTSEWMRAALVSGVVGGLMFADQSIDDFFVDNQSGFGDAIFSVKPIGNSKHMLATYGGVYAVGAVFGDEKMQETALLGLQGFAIAGLFSESAKKLFGRSRPDKEGASSWDFEGLGGGNSFVSGHATVAFTAATIFSEQYKNHWYVPPAAYTLASLVAMSRVYDNDHWMSDVVAGAVLGYSVGKIVTYLSPFIDGSRQMSLMPNISGDNYGVNLVMKH